MSNIREEPDPRKWDLSDYADNTSVRFREQDEFDGFHYNDTMFEDASDEGCVPSSILEVVCGEPAFWEHSEPTLPNGALWDLLSFDQFSEFIEDPYYVEEGKKEIVKALDGRPISSEAIRELFTKDRGKWAVLAADYFETTGGCYARELYETSIETYDHKRGRMTVVCELWITIGELKKVLSTIGDRWDSALASLASLGAIEIDPQPDIDW